MALATRKKPWFSGGLHARRNPYPMMLGLAMGSSTILFVFILAMLLARKATTGFGALDIPWVFYFSTVLIAVSSATLWVARQHFLAERYRQHLNWSGITLVAGLGFMLLQIEGWLSLYRSGQTLADSLALAFLYLLSGLHFGHMALAMGLLFWAVMDSSRNRTYVEGYLQSIDPAKRTRLLMAYWFWHFTDGLWLLLLMAFVFVLGR